MPDNSIQDQLKLFELQYEADAPLENHSFSPYVWKTKIDLAILGIEYSSRGLSFCQIRDELPVITGKEQGVKVTVPTLCISSTEGEDRYITDSWDIAMYLDETYSSPGKSLFGDSQSSKSYAKFLNGWADSTLALTIRFFILPKVYDHCDEPSKDHFMKTKFSNDPSAFQTFKDKISTPEKYNAQIQEAIRVLKPLDALLSNPKEKQEYLNGNQPGHVDAIVFGWYAFHKRNDGESATKVWSEELSGVKSWVERMTERFVKETL